MRRGEVAGGFAARHLPHSSNSPSPRRSGVGRGGKGVGLDAIDSTAE